MSGCMTATRLENRAIIRLTPLEEGESAAGFLQGLLTNDVAGELPVYAALLSAQGKTMFDMIVWPGSPGEHGAAILLDCEAGVAADLADARPSARTGRQRRAAAGKKARGTDLGPARLPAVAFKPGWF